jgi:transcriptional regulator with XRE-family HTH domain
LTITTPDDLKAARHRLGWSLRQMARALRLKDPDGKGADHLREMEENRRPITGPVTAAAEAYRDGWRPEGWSDDDAAD